MTVSRFFLRPGSGFRLRGETDRKPCAAKPFRSGKQNGLNLRLSVRGLIGFDRDADAAGEHPPLRRRHRDRIGIRRSGSQNASSADTVEMHQRGGIRHLAPLLIQGQTGEESHILAVGRHRSVFQSEQKRGRTPGRFVEIRNAAAPFPETNRFRRPGS